MKKIRLFILMSVFMTSLAACGSDDPQPVISGDDNNGNTEIPADGKILVAYFSWVGPQGAWHNRLPNRPAVHFLK